VGRTATLRPTTLKVAREHWQVLIPAAHAGYITWAEYERNQVTLSRNAGAFAAGRRGSLPREGTALLQGRVVCGLCGERMRVRYQKTGHQLRPYYQCTEVSVRKAGKLCQSIAGRNIDAAISTLLLERVTASALEAALAVQEEIAARIDEADTLRCARLERGRYNAELARRRYVNVDPDNRLVADALEADWNEQLRRLDELQQDHDRQREADKVLLSDDMRARITALAKDFPRVWNDPRTAPVERKRMVALLLEDVTLVKSDAVSIHVRFRGGKTQSLSIPRPLPMSRIRKTLPEVVVALDNLLETCSDQAAAEALNTLGHRNWRGESFTAKKVMFVRRTYALKSHYERLRARGFLTITEMCEHCHVSMTCIHTWARAGLLQRVRWGGGAKSLYALQPGAVVEKGRGGRRPKAPSVTTVPSSEQETV
jgi:hypothetical protein